MDKFFSTDQPVPTLSSAELDRMTEVALSYRQHVPTNQNTQSAGRFWAPWWITGLSVAACVLLVFGVVTSQTSLAPVTASTETAHAASSDAYAEVTELAILDTLDSF